MDLRSIQLLAMQAVRNPDGGAHLRRIFRWYSKTFHTPLHQVYDLEVEEVLQAYFEERYSNLEEEELEEELALLLETEEERRARESKETLQKYEDDQFAAMVEAQERAKEEARKPKGPGLPSLPAPAQVLPASTPTTPLLVGPPLPKVAASPLPEKLPPDIKMEFLDPAAFEEEANGLGALATPE